MRYFRSEKVLAYFVTRLVDLQTSLKDKFFKKAIAQFFQKYFRVLQCRFCHFLQFVVWKNCLLKVEDLHFALSTNDVNIFRIIGREVFYEIYVLNSFVKFTGKHMYWSLFFNKIEGLACNFITKATLEQVQNFKHTFFIEHLYILFPCFEHLSC